MKIYLKNLVIDLDIYVEESMNISLRLITKIYDKIAEFKYFGNGSKKIKKKLYSQKNWEQIKFMEWLVPLSLETSISAFSV
jgi:hypothetical protein